MKGDGYPVRVFLFVSLKVFYAHINLINTGKENKCVFCVLLYMKDRFIHDFFHIFIQNFFFIICFNYRVVDFVYWEDFSLSFQEINDVILFETEMFHELFRIYGGRGNNYV